jgi:hypothetical protein
MYELKKIKKTAVPRALDKVDQYRLLNDPVNAESICRDILSIEPDNQKALVKLILTLTDQFNMGVTSQEAISFIPEIKDEYQREYYKGIICERQGKAMLSNNISFKHDVFEWFEEAMEAFEKADSLSPADNNEAILRWNSCVRTIERHKLTKKPLEPKNTLHLPLE